MTRAIAKKPPPRPAEILTVERAAELLAASKKVDEVKKIHDSAAAIRLYLRQQKASVAAQNDAAEIIILSQRRLGELTRTLTQAPRGGGEGKGPKAGTLPTKRDALASEGITKQDASRWEKLAAIPESQLRAHIASVRERGAKLTLTSTIGAVSHGGDYDSDEWYTPPDVIARVRKVLGRIDLDVASCAHAQAVVQAAHYFAKKDNALEREWWGRIFMNCPYSLAGEFADAWIEEQEATRVKAGVALYNASTDTAWFHRLAERHPFVLTKGRIAFLMKNGQPIEGNRVGQVFFYHGPDPRLFRQTFGDVGLFCEARAA